MKNRFFKLFIFSLFVFLAVSCEVGLGESVDTEKPTVSIDYPQSGVVIRDSFVVSGACDDETGLKKVEVTLTTSKNADSSSNSSEKKLSGKVVTIGPYTAEFTDSTKKAWKLELNKLDERGSYPLADGDYTISVTATDNSGRLSAEGININVKIDNTPPLVILTNPSTSIEKKELKKASGFGSEIRLKGTIVDDSINGTYTDSDLYFSVFDAENSDKYISRILKDGLSNDLDLVIGEYSESTTDLTEENVFYNSIYGESVSADIAKKYRKFKITVSDSARPYKGSGTDSSNLRGNVSDVYYINSEFYSTLKSVGGTQVLYPVLNGTSTLTQAEQATILAKVQEYAHKTDDIQGADDSSRAASSEYILPVGTFYLMPKNNPTYEVSSFDAFDATSEEKWQGKTISNSGTITVMANVGLSSTPFPSDYEDVFKLYIFAVDDDGNKKDGAEKIELDCEWSQNGDNYIGRAKLSEKIVTVGSKYGIELEGYDQDGLEFYNGTKIYRFAVESGANPPTLSDITYNVPNSGSTVYLKKSDSSDNAVDLVITGKAVSNSGNEEGYVTLYPSINGTKYTELKTKTKSNTENDWSITILGKYFTGRSDNNYTVTLFATDEIQNEGTKDINVFYDEEPPEISVNAINSLSSSKTTSGIVTYDEDTTIKIGNEKFTAKTARGYVNDKIKIQGGIADNSSVKSASYKVLSEDKAICEGEITKFSSFEFEVDTTKFKDETATTNGKDLVIQIQAYDLAGNVRDYSYKYDDGNNLVIHQFTDYPQITLNNADITVSSEDGVKSETNLFDTKSNNKISIGASDDNGLDKITVLYKSVSDTGDYKTLKEINAGGKTTYSGSVALEYNSAKLDEGFYSIKITAADSKTDSTRQKTYESDAFVICISNSEPQISFENPKSNSVEYQRESFTASGTVTGQFKTGAKITRGTGESIKEIEITEKDGVYSWSEEITCVKTTDGNVTYVDLPDYRNGEKEKSGISTADGLVYTIKYDVTDRFDRTTEAEVSFKSDFTPPVVEINDYGKNAYIGTSLTTLYSFTGTVTDENALNSVEYSLNNGAAWVNAGNQKNFNANVDFKDRTDSGEITVLFRATDSAGNVSTITDKSKRTVTFIGEAPKFSGVEVTLESNSTGLTAEGEIYYAKAKYEITGKVTSAALKDLSCQGETVHESEETDTECDFIISNLEESKTFEIIATDMAEQKTTYRVSVVFDNSSPSIDITQVTPVVTSTSYTDVQGKLKKYTNGAVNGTIKINGTSNDDDKVSSTRIEVYKALDSSGAISADTDKGVLQSLGTDGTSNKTGDALSIPSGVTNSANRFQFYLDTTKLADEAGIVIRIVSCDRAGNEAYKDYPVYVSQKTDTPELSFGNGYTDVLDESEITTTKNLFGMGANTLYINVSDDDGVKSVSYTADVGSEISLLTDGTSTTFSTQIDVSTLGDGVHGLRFKVTDINGKVQEFPSDENASIKVAYDNDVPEISVLKLGDVNYSPNCFAKKKFTISGNVKDSSGTVTVYLRTTASGTVTDTEVAKITDCTSEQEWKEKDVTNNSGEISRTYVVKDKYGREKSLEIKYKVDTEAPKFVSNYIYLSGETVSGTKKYVLASSTGDSTEVYNSENVWFIGSSFSIKGGDGTNSKVPVTEENNFEIKLYLGSKSTENLISTIQPGGNNNFSGTIDVGSKNNSSIILVAVDEAGNESDELKISVNVDKSLPTINTKEVYVVNPDTAEGAAAITNNSYVNSDKIYIKYSVTDDVSGIGKVEIFENSKMQNSLGSKTESEGVFTVDVSDATKYKSGVYDFYIKVTDNAGNSTSSDLTDFILDRVAPVVKYNSPVESAEVNKNLTISGTITDSYPPETNEGWKWSLKVKQNGKTSFDTVSGVTFDITKSVGEFSVSGIDTTALADGETKFLVIATDAAGNTITEENGTVLTVKVNQDSDRPVINLSTISTAGTTTLSSGAISGTISDDDGIKSLQIFVATNKQSVSDISDSDWQNATLNASNWSYTYTSSSDSLDGDYKLYFKVTDGAGGIFISSDSDLENSAATQDVLNRLKCPKIQYSGTNTVSSAVSFSIDGNPPVIRTFEYKTSADNSTYSDWKTVQQNTIFGGTNYKYVQFRIKAYDTVTEQSDLALVLKIDTVERKTSDETAKLNDSAATDTDGYYFFETTAIDFTNFATGSYTLQLSVSDKADKPATTSIGVTVDNTAPTSISRVTPNSSEEVSGDITYKGQVADDSKGNSGIEKMYYVIPVTTITSTENIKDSSDTTASFGEKWVEINLDGSTVTWEFTVNTLDNIYSKSDSDITVKTGYTGYETATGSGIYNLPVWFKLVDAAGNVGYNSSNSIRYNPNADKPKVSVTSPVHNVTDSANKLSYVVMGGTIRFTGTAEDNEGIEAVYLQFDMDGDGTFENGLSSDGTTVITGCPYEATEVGSILGSTDLKGIRVKGTTSWSYSLNVSKLSGLLYSETNKKTLNVRAVAVDNTTSRASPTNLVGAWAETIHISINNDIPAFESAKLYQFNGAYNASTNKTPIKIVEYADDEYVSGDNWYLVGKVSSNAGVSSFECTGSTTATITIETGTTTTDSEPTITEGSEYVFAKTVESGNLKDLTFIIPFGTVSDNWKVRVEVTDNASSGNQKTNYLNYSVNVDDTAPAFVDTRTADEKNTYGTVKIYKGTYGSVALDSENKVQNSNGLFTLAGRVSEAGSGYENVIFYFKRTDSSGGNVRVYNPMKAHTVEGGTNPGKENRTDITKTTATDKEVYINSDNLPVLYLASVTRNTDNLFTIYSDSLKNNDNIRVGGLVKIGGTYRRITKVSDGTVTIDSECEATSTTAEFVYGMVIDNTGESLNTDNSVKNDDGDGMCESYAKSGVNYTWDASIDSTNIPDGPIEIHVVAFDKAGNSSHGYAITAVSNNAPRIARVKFATDLNSNGTYESNEEQVFTYLEGDTTVWSETTKSSGTEIWNLDTNGWTIKNKLQVTPEFVGGTAPFTYVFSKVAGSADANNLSSPNEKDASGVTTGTISANKTPFEIANSALDSSSTYEKQINTYRFSFWDSTEETTPGKDSQWSILNAKLKQNIVDGVKPTAKINPFYWNSASDNSLYENSLDNGHIELEADWKNANGYDLTKTTGVYDGDPKVSGKIVFTGEAYDNVRLDSVWIKFKSAATSFTFENYITTGSLYGTSGISGDYVLAAVYDTAKNDWSVPTATMETDGWTFEIEDESFDQSGHKALWSLSIDTSKISTVAASDIPVSVMAVEHIEYTDTTETTTKNGLASDVAEYRVDVVPYITSLGTSLTSIEKRNPSVYGRSALGRYPVYFYSKDKNGSTDAESITFNGFNLSGGTVTFESTTTTTGVTGTLSDNAVTLPSGAKSGKVSVTVNSITTLNNVNNNDAIGSYSGTVADNEYAYAYNRQPNGQNNNILTDDVEIAVWELKSKVAIPSESSADAVIMHVNPSNGLLGFAFTHGADLVSYPNGTTNSYQDWAKDWTSISQNSLDFVYDANGNMFGTHSGTDTASTYYKASRYRICSSVWGVTSDWKTTADYNTAYGRYNALRLEYMGYYNNSTNTLVPEKIKGSRLATTTSVTGTNLYLLYYDSSLDMLKFKAGGTVPKDFSNTNYIYGKYTASTTKFGDFADDANLNEGNYSPKYSNISVLTKTTASRYFAISAVPASVSGNNNDVALALWYDPNTNNLLYSYLEDPLGSAGSRDSSGNVDTNWSKPIAILDGDSDGNCAIEVDSEGHVHIAARTLDEGGSLCYVYLDNYQAKDYTTDNVVMVDGYDSTGTYLTLDIAKNDENGRTIPYIGYMTSRGYVKYAYLVDTETASSSSTYVPKSGSDSENLVTGAWETILVPKKNQIVSSDNSKISIGVFRDMSTDVIKAIPASIAGITESAGTEKGYALGNGTKNAILGYGITIGGNGYAETAQLK